MLSSYILFCLTEYLSPNTLLLDLNLYFNYSICESKIKTGCHCKKLRHRFAKLYPTEPIKVRWGIFIAIARSVNSYKSLTKLRDLDRL